MQRHSEKTFYVYMTANKSRGVIYTGTWEHRARVLVGFTKRFWVDRLVYFEPRDDVEVAQRREWLLKGWRRDWKIELIEKTIRLGQ